MKYLTIDGRPIDRVCLLPSLAECSDFEENNPDFLVFFRVQDCYEAYSDNAVRIASLLGLMLTTKEATESTDPLNRIQLISIHSGAMDAYAKKLVALGEAVSICDTATTDDNLSHNYVRSWFTTMPQD